MLEPLESRIAPSSLVTITDATGDLVTVELKGPGTANVTLVGGAGNNADIDQIALANTDLTSKLTVKVATNDTIVNSIVTTGVQQHLGTIDLFPGVKIGSGVADATPDVRVTGKLNELLIVSVQANTIFRLGEDLPYDVPNDTKTPDTYNNRPVVELIDIMGPGVELNVIGDGVTSQGTGGGGLGKVTIGQWNFPGFIRTTQSIESITVLFGDFNANLEVDNHGLGAKTVANLGSFKINNGAYLATKGEVEGFIGPFDANAFIAGATLTAASLGKVSIDSSFDGTITLLDPDSDAIPSFTVGTDFTGTVITAAPIKKLAIKGDFMGSLQSPLIGSISAFAYLGSKDLAGTPTTFIRATNGGLGTLTSIEGPISDFEISANLVFKGIKVVGKKLAVDTVGLNNVHITAASIGNISVSLKPNKGAGAINLVGIQDSTFTTTGTGATKKDAGSIGNISVSIAGLGNGVSATGILDSTFDALVGDLTNPGSTANSLGKISVKLAGSGGASLGLGNAIFEANSIGATSVEVKRAASGSARAVNNAQFSALGAIGAITLSGEATATQASFLKVWAGTSVDGVTVKSKDGVNGTLADSSILAGQLLTLNGASDKEQLAALKLASLGSVSVSGGLTATQLVSGGSIGAVTVGGAMDSSLVLAGARLGGDFAIDGDETYQRVASIAAVTVKGTLNASSVAAGVNPGDSIFGNGDDALADAVAFVDQTSSIGPVTIGAGANGTPGLNHGHAIEAATLKALKIGANKIDLATLPVFLDSLSNGEDAQDVLVRLL